MPKALCINGAGRIGRLLFKIALINSDYDLICINDKYYSVDDFLYFLKYDTKYGRVVDLINESFYTTDVKSGIAYEIKFANYQKSVYYSNYTKQDYQSLVDFCREVGYDGSVVIDCSGTTTDDLTYNDAKSMLFAGVDTPPKIETDIGFASVIYGLTDVRDIQSWYNDYKIRTYFVPKIKTQNALFIYKAIETFGITNADVKNILQYTNLQKAKDDYSKSKRFIELGRGVDNIVDTTYPNASAAIAGNWLSRIGFIADLNGIITASNIYVPIAFGGMTVFSAITTKSNILFEDLQTALKNATTNIVRYTEDEVVSSDVFSIEQNEDYHITSPVCTFCSSMSEVYTTSIGTCINVTSMYDPEYGLALQTYNTKILLDGIFV